MQNTDLAKSDKIGKLRDGYQELNASVSALIVSTPEQEADAAGLLSTAKGNLKIIEDERKAFTVPLNKILKGINAASNTIKSPYEKMEFHIKGLMNQYQTALSLQLKKEEEAKRKKEREIEERQRKIDEDKARALKIKDDAEREAALKKTEQAEKRVEKSEALLANKPTTEVGKTARSANGGTTSYKKVLKFEIVDPVLVPREYLVVNESLVRKAVNDGWRNIAGVRIWEENQVVSR